MSISEVMGVALGCIHLSLDDFLCLRPEEFDAVYNASVGDREAEFRSGWEQTRTLASITIAPHVKRAPTPQKLLPLPWDKTKRRTESGVGILSKEAAKARFEQLARR